MPPLPQATHKIPQDGAQGGRPSALGSLFSWNVSLSPIGTELRPSASQTRDRDGGWVPDLPSDQLQALKSFMKQDCRRATFPRPSLLCWAELSTSGSKGWNSASLGKLPGQPNNSGSTPFRQLKNTQTCRAGRDSREGVQVADPRDPRLSCSRRAQVPTLLRGLHSWP